MICTSAPKACCRAYCHAAVSKDHPRNIDPAMSFPKGLPMAAGVSWTCFTCHEPHGTTTNLMCVSCHVTDKGHHPTGLPLPEFMAEAVRASGKVLKYEAKGRVTCYTCHDKGCATGVQRMTVRYYGGANQTLDLCWICHDRMGFGKVSPHVEDDRLFTLRNESMPIPGLSRGLMTIPKMVCLRCHQVKPHPANADHLRAVPEKSKPDESLPLGPGE